MTLMEMRLWHLLQCVSLRVISFCPALPFQATLAPTS